MAHASRGGSKGRKTSFEAFSTHSSLGAPRRKRKSAKKYALQHGHFTAASPKKEESEKTATFIASVSSCPTRAAVLDLAVTVALLVVLYVCKLCVYCAHRAVKKSAPGSGAKMRDYLR